MVAAYWPQILLGAIFLGLGGRDSPDVLCPCEDEKQVHVTVVAILATDRNTEVDPRLKCIAGAVKDLNEKYTGFQLATQTCEAIPLGGKKRFPLIDDLEACVEATRCSEHPERVCLRVQVPKLGCVKFSSVCGKFLPLMTGYETREKQRLFIAVMVKPCKVEE